jgi:hypothetical protein
MANRNFASGGKIYSMHVMPVLLDCNFIVDAADEDGYGITNLKGPAIADVFMNTSAGTPASDSPEPAAGTIVVRLADNFNRQFISGLHVIQSPLSGSDVKIDNSAMTAGVAYTITTLGNATAAKWHAIGVPAGVTPAVGVSFIAASNGGAGNTLTSRVQITAATGSGIASIEVVGNPDLSISPSPSANQGYGGQIILQCRDYAGAIAAPADGSRISLAFYLSNSSVVIQGE